MLCKTCHGCKGYNVGNQGTGPWVICRACRGRSKVKGWMIELLGLTKPAFVTTYSDNAPAILGHPNKLYAKCFVSEREANQWAQLYGASYNYRVVGDGD